jgi:hypothetical protein
MKIFGRDPAFWLNGVALLVAWLSTWFLHLSPEVQSVINAAAVALMGLIIAFVTGDGQVAAIAGLIKALIALGLGLGLRLDAAHQTTLLSLVVFVSTMYIRTQVVAPVPPLNSPPVRTP